MKTRIESMTQLVAGSVIEYRLNGDKWIVTSTIGDNLIRCTKISGVATGVKYNLHFGFVRSLYTLQGE